jgi:hypothetical protein
MSRGCMSRGRVVACHEIISLNVLCDVSLKVLCEFCVSVNVCYVPCVSVPDVCVCVCVCGLRVCVCGIQLYV